MMSSIQQKTTPSRGVVFCFGEGEELSRAAQELATEGFSISRHLSADAALREASRTPPVAFVMSGGLEVPLVCRRLRNDLRHAFTPVFVLSTAEVKDRLTALSAGADECGPFPVSYLPQAIQARRERLSALRSLVSQDDLTGLLSHQGLKNVLPKEIARSVRYGWPLSVAFVDLDGLAQWNEAHGQNAGDALLAALSEAFRYGLRDADVVARVGGDEFVLLLPHADLSGARGALERCRQLFWALPLGVEGAPRGSFSAGIAQLAEQERDGRPLLERAIQGLLYAKEQGNGTLFCQPTPQLEQVS